MKKKVIIFGAGYHGRNVLRACKHKKLQAIFFIDNNSKNLSEKIMNIKVHSPNILKKFNDFHYIIISGRHIEEMKKQLTKIKIDKKKIIIWGKKNLRIQRKNFIKRSKDVNQSLKKITSQLKKNKVNFWLDAGALLFVARNQDLAETADVDIIVNLSDLTIVEKICKRISKKYQNYECKIQFYYSVLLKKRVKKIVLIKSNGKNINYEPAIFEFNCLVNKNKFFETLARNKIFSYNYWKDEYFIKYGKMHLPVPLKFKKYLKSIYGQNWNKKLNFYYNSQI